MKVTRRNALMGAAPVAVAAAAVASSAPAPAHAWGAAEIDATIPHAPVPHSHVRHNGQHHPVNGHWHEANTAKFPHLAARTRDELRQIQDGLLEKSNNPFTPLSTDELAYLKAANNHFDVRTSIEFLRGRDHREFGFDGVDQVHGAWITYTCGCKLAIVVDHHKAVARVEHKAHPHAPAKVCDDHAGHQHDLALLHERVAADSLTRA